jgi:leucyl/phenylalanyl-tRNA--protein transferase
MASVDWLRAAGVVLYDVQWTTPHLASMGVVDVPRNEYLNRLADAVHM